MPIAMSVMSGEQMRDNGITDMNEAATLIPNVSINTDFYAMYIRGIGTAEANVLAEQAIGFIIDGVYLARIEFLRPGFIDVERMEVLRGPQGTLFGRNSPAGVINITSGLPSDEWTGRFELTGGEREKLDVRATLGGPIVDDLTFRVTAGHNRNDGHTLNLTTNETSGDRENTFVKGRLRWDISNGLDAMLTTTVYEYDVRQFIGVEQHNTPQELETLFLTLDPEFEDTINREGTSAPEGSGSKGEGIIAGFEVNVDVGEYTLTSVTGFAGYDDKTGGDLDATAFPVIGGFYEQTYDQWTQELRLTSGPGFIDFVGGLFYMHSETDATVDIDLLRNITVNQLTANLLPGVLGGITDPILGQVLGAIGLNTLFEGDKLAGEYAIEIDSYAGFLQANVNLTDTFKIILGGRYTFEEKYFTASLGPTAPVSIWQIYLGGNGYQDEERDFSETDFSPKVSVTWDPIEEITLYGTYARGYRAGSFNITALTADDLQFDSEVSYTIDFGAKTEFWDQRARFNIGFFQTDYENLQLSTFQSVTFVNSNAEEARIRGLEMDLTVLPIEGMLVTLAAGYTDGKFIKHTNAGCTSTSILDLSSTEGPGVIPPNNVCDLSGRPLHRAPEWTGSAIVGFGIPLGNLPFVGTVAGVASYKGFEFMDSDLDPIDSQDEYWLFNLRAGFRDIDEMWSFEVHVKNLTDELVKVFSSDVPITIGAHMAQTNAPRTVSATFRVEF
ncbi:MAG: TonB-dependent receptor [Alphaproteobacteria bacterium]